MNKLGLYQKTPQTNRKNQTKQKKTYLKNLGINLRKGKQDSYTAN